MHRSVTLQVVTATLHTISMRTIGRDAAEILRGNATLDRHSPVLIYSSYRQYRNRIDIQV